MLEMTWVQPSAAGMQPQGSLRRYRQRSGRSLGVPEKGHRNPFKMGGDLGIAGSQAGTTGAKAFRPCLSVPSRLSPTRALLVHGRCGAPVLRLQAGSSHPSPRPLSSPPGGALAQGPTGASKAQLSPPPGRPRPG